MAGFPFLCSTGNTGLQTPVFTETKAIWSTWEAPVEARGDTGAMPSRPRKSEARASSSLPVSHLGASQAGHGFFQVLSKIQNILYCPLSLRLWIWQGKQKEVVNEKDFLKAPGSQGRGDRQSPYLIDHCCLWLWFAEVLLTAKTGITRKVSCGGVKWNPHPTPQTSFAAVCWCVLRGLGGGDTVMGRAYLFPLYKYPSVASFNQHIMGHRSEGLGHAELL